MGESVDKKGLEEALDIMERVTNASQARKERKGKQIWLTIESPPYKKNPTDTVLLYLIIISQRIRYIHVSNVNLFII